MGLGDQDNTESRRRLFIFQLSAGYGGAMSPRWLDSQEQAAWRSYLRAAKLLDEELRRGLERHGLSHPEYEILVRLSEAPGRVLRMSELASSVVSSRSRLTHTVARLESAGHVVRRPCPADGRGVQCALTDAGFHALEEAAHTHVDGVRRYLLDAMSRAEFLALGASMAKVADAIDPERRITV
ncbi:MAG: MarR family winged helix-turn-helix transcriptional regulator [Angustibacter sp.]